MWSTGVVLVLSWTSYSANGFMLSKESLRENIEVNKQPFLDIDEESCHNCFRLQCDASAHRSMIVLESTKPLPVLHDWGFFVHYVNSQPESAELMWRDGRISMVWPEKEMGGLPYADMSIDVVVIKNSALTAFHFSQILSESARILVPAGALLLLDDVKRLPQFTLSPLISTTKFRNVFWRLNGHASELSVCDKKVVDTFWHNRKKTHNPWTSPHRARGDGTWTCQPYIPEGFVSLNDTQRRQDILEAGSLARGRYLHALPDNTWAANTSVFSVPRYSGADGIKSEWRQFPKLTELVKKGHVTRLLDAGAGTCTLYGELLRDNIEEKVTYTAFGGYDADMLQYCGERGVVAFDWDWTNEMPLCANCQFDLIVQFEGLHHSECDVPSVHLIRSDSEPVCPQLFRTFENFYKHLACGGFMFLQDLHTGPGFVEWTSIFNQWRKTRDIVLVEKMSLCRKTKCQKHEMTEAVFVQKKCDS